MARSTPPGIKAAADRATQPKASPGHDPAIKAAARRGEIISRLPERNHKFKHHEYICDPRGVAYESFSIAELPDPRI